MSLNLLKYWIECQCDSGAQAPLLHQEFPVKFQMNYSNLVKSGQSDGPGIRVSLFVSGCEHNCKGCFNSDAFDYDAGQPFTDRTLSELLTALDDPYITGLSILGGDPLMERNYPEVLSLIKTVRQTFPDKTIWVWTGYKMAFVRGHRHEILHYIDALVDGKYVQSKQPIQYRGSSNQKIWYKSDIEFTDISDENVVKRLR